MINDNFFKLRQTYVFSEVAKKIAEFKRNNPNVALTSYGIGDVVFPLSKTVAETMENASKRLATTSGFLGYQSEGGMPKLRDAISDYYLNKLKVKISADDVFVSDGAKSDLGGLLDLFCEGSVALISNPSYPAYADAATMRGLIVSYVAATPQNGFLPLPPEDKSDVVFLCSPSNPTGVTYDKTGLLKWVAYAKRCGAVIIFDAAYSFFAPLGYPKSIFEVEGADEVAVEVNSFSKSFGFTGVRCGYTVMTDKLQVGGVSLKEMWKRRQAARFNGASVIAQAGAIAALTETAISEAEKTVAHYVKNGEKLKNRLLSEGLEVYGSAPYLWVRCPQGFTDETYFDYLLKNKRQIVTPGSGFGSFGKDFVRYSCFFT